MNDILGEVIEDSIFDGIRELFFFWLDNTTVVILKHRIKYLGVKGHVSTAYSQIYLYYTNINKANVTTY